MSVIVKEIPSPKWVLFYEARLPFVPFEGDLWLSETSVMQALGIGSARDFHGDLEHIDARRDGWFRKLELAGYAINAEPYFPIPSLRHLAETTVIYQGTEAQFDRIERFVALLDELAAQPRYDHLLHSHTCSTEGAILRSVLEKHPHWAGVLELWNKGATEGEIAKTLRIDVTKVRSAVQGLERNGFEVLRGELRDAYAASGGRVPYVPNARLSTSSSVDTSRETSNVTPIHKKS